MRGSSIPALPAKIPQKYCVFLREPYSGGSRAERGGRVVKIGAARAGQPFRLLFSIACHGLGGARSDAAGGHGFCPQWQKPQFATRAHHTVVMRITRGSPPCTGEARGDVEWSPSCHPNMRTFLRHPEHGTKWSGGIPSFVTTRSLPWDSSSQKLLGMTGERDTPRLRPVGARAPPRRNAPASRHFSYVGTSPLWGSCAASSECSCKQAFLLASDGMTVSVLTVSCPPYVIPPALISCILPAAPYNGGIIFSEERT